MYQIKMLCFNPDGSKYEDYPTHNGPWETFDEAYDSAFMIAEDEADSLNDGCDDGVSFGVVADEDKDYIYVNYYYNEEGDDTGNTERVTIYSIEEIKTNLINKESETTMKVYEVTFINLEGEYTSVQLDAANEEELDELIESLAEELELKEVVEIDEVYEIYDEDNDV